MMKFPVKWKHREIERQKNSMHGLYCQLFVRGKKVMVVIIKIPLVLFYIILKNIISKTISF